MLFAFGRPADGVGFPQRTCQISGDKTLDLMHFHLLIFFLEQVKSQFLRIATLIAIEDQTSLPFRGRVRGSSRHEFAARKRRQVESHIPHPG